MATSEHVRLYGGKGVEESRGTRHCHGHGGVQERGQLRISEVYAMASNNFSDQTITKNRHSDVTEE